MKTDRELLELAARSLGFELHVNEVEATQLFSNGEYVCFWKPLDDDGDALRLAVSLRIAVSVFSSDVAAQRAGWPISTESLGQDHFAATRRAIVRAAAAIGETAP